MEIGALLAELKVCSNTKDLKTGKQIHADAVKSGNESCIYVANSLVSMYSKCGSMVDAYHVFDRIKHPTVVSWNALIAGYAENGEGFTALDLFATMKTRGCTPDCVTYVAAIKACTSLALNNARETCMERGKQIQLEIGRHLNRYVLNTLIDMYSKCGCMVEARRVFDSIRDPDVVSWNALMMGYADNGEGRTALDIFARMRLDACAPSPVTFVVALKACCSLAKQRCREQGKSIHSQIGGTLCNILVQNSLIEMYAKGGNMPDARHVFNSMAHPDTVSWTTLMMGYAENGEGITALILFATMKSRGCVPDCRTFSAVLKACGLLGALDSGIKIHEEIGTATEGNVILVTCLVDFYAKCGNLVKAQELFDCHPRTRNLRTWNALLTGYSHLGDDDAVFRLFKQMQGAGFRPDGVTFLSILTCCTHAGLAENASQLLETMLTTYRVSPTIEHYTCMVDLLGRLNKLDDAMALLRTCRPDAVAWMTILGACRKWKNVQVGKLAFKSLASLDDMNAPAYVVMAQIYKSRGMRKEQKMMLGMRKTWFKEPGQSNWTNEVADMLPEVHIF